MPKNIKQSLNAAFLKQKPLRREIDDFKKEFAILCEGINLKESEEFHKNLIIKFLNAVYYKNNFYINTKDRSDLVIHNGEKAASSVGVLIETKSPKNNTEMPKIDNLNCKAFQELVLYYFRERKTQKNFELRHLIITNVYEWFVFDSQDFEKLFYRNNALLKNFEQFEDKKLAMTTTDSFYKEIASPEIQKIQEQIPFTHFDIRNFNIEDDKNLVDLYKFFSPENLLKLPFLTDNNQLNKEFYGELLHIIGLEEVKQDGKKLIVRKAEGNRDCGSIIENAIMEIQQDGKSKNDDIYELALDLSITWINRILFLKLLEAQILKYHNQDKKYAFLSSEKLSGYNDLNKLFFLVLAKKEDERVEPVKTKFAAVPYLNSSLFEQTETEINTIRISSLQDNAEISLYAKSVLLNKNNERGIIPPLEYLLRFLDAYDFGGDENGEISQEEKPLISASVLGLIFEKINGYKDGAFFTPSFITMYMCRETIGRAVVQKFNEIKGWNCGEIDDLANHIGRKTEEIKEANKIFNTIRICDPAVGSGHFLVSALNEMIYLKSKLGILADKDGKALWNYDVSIENDELIVKNPDGNIFAYAPKNTESCRVQETFFREKQTIIENCLFGVDINPNSVKICRLRLWIELLKNTFYRKDTGELETLPNIEYKVIVGDSLMRITSNNELLQSNMFLKANSEEMKKLKDMLFAETNKDKNRELRKQIDDKISETLRFSKEYSGVDIDFDLTLSFSDIWLENKGFDVVIGNPPYIQLQTMGGITGVYKNMAYQVFERTGDIYCLFYERGFQLLKPQGILSFITSNKWMRAGYGEATRRFLAENTNPEQLIDFAGVKVFDEATVDVNILMFSKDKNRQKTQACIVKKEDIKELSVFIRQHSSICKFNTCDSWVVLSPIEQSIKSKIEAVGTPLKEWDINIYRGILTGYNEAFIIDGNKKDELIKQDPKSAGIIRPILRGRDIKRYGYEFADLWLINTHNGIREKSIKPINIEDYPAIKNHLDKYYPELEKRQDKGETPYNLRNCAYLEDFNKQKIVWAETIKEYFNSDRNFPRFSYDSKQQILDKTCFMLLGKDIKFLLGILNSSVIEYYLRQSVVKLGAGSMSLSKVFIEQIPIIKVSPEILRKIENLTEQIIFAKKDNLQADTADLEREIDLLVYELYGLSEEEISVVEGRE